MTAKKKYADIITQESLSAFAPHTQRQYAGAWRAFLRWSKKKRRREILPLTSKDLMAYLQDLADQGRKWATIQVHKATILKAHRRAGLPNPADNEAFTDELRNLARAIGKHQTQMTGLTETCVEAIAATAHIPRITRGAQTELPQSAQRRANFDLALIHTMRDGLLRSSEASNLLWRDLETYQDGTGRVLVRRSKTDQSGEGTLLYLSRTAVSALHLIRPKNPPPGERIFPSAPTGSATASSWRPPPRDSPATSADTAPGSAWPSTSPNPAPGSPRSSRPDAGRTPICPPATSAASPPARAPWPASAPPAAADPSPHLLPASERPHRAARTRAATNTQSGNPKPCASRYHARKQSHQEALPP